MRVASRALFVLLVALAWVTGCSLDGTLDPNGSGRLRIRLRLVSVAHLEKTKASLQSTDVTVTSATMTDKKWATFELAFRNLGALRAVPALSSTQIALADAGEGLQTLTVAIEPGGLAVPPSYFTYLGREFRIALTLPGDVVRSNATTMDGRTATWVRSLDEMQHQGPAVFTATFRAAAAS